MYSLSRELLHEAPLRAPTVPPLVKDLHPQL